MSYFEIMLETRSIYGRAICDKALNMYQAFAYVYDEMSCFLQSADDRIRAEAFTALFVVAVMDGLAFVSDDSFTQDVFEELSTVYSRVSCLGLDVEGSDDEKLMLQHVEKVSIYTGIVVG
ncbi:hypothetical protein [Pseudomonas sp. NPDC089734]|uniref:hypothetical protein n=1 Tax=Pseudomonas sp. NPDC089734 TaxID=3364469 RepID=UPI0038093D04